MKQHQNIKPLNINQTKYVQGIYAENNTLWLNKWK